MQHTGVLAGRTIALMSWRDTHNPEGGGAELYLEQVARGLLERGAQVTIFCAAYAGAAPEETVDGIRFVRRGGKLSVYLQGMRALRRGDLGDVDLVVDVQNGLPFFSRLVTRKPVVLVVHHVHREQWPVVYPGLTGRVGWFIERNLAPRIYRRSQYVTVSHATRVELGELGIGAHRVAVVPIGSDFEVPVIPGKAAVPTIAVVCRLVPHKQVEHAIDAALELRADFPDLRLEIVGGGWWEGALHEYAASRGAADTVVFHGHVSEEEKHAVYERAWVFALPSLKEGWGLVVGEAGMHATPTVAYRYAGGTQESVSDTVSGMLVDDYPEFVAALRLLLSDEVERARLGEGARAMSHSFTWEHAQETFADIVVAALEGRHVGDDQPSA